MRLSAILLPFAAIAASCSAALAEPSVEILPLGFAASEFRGPGSRVAAVAASTDALRGEASVRDTPLVLVWGREGGAALAARDGAVRAIPLGRAAADLAAAERGRDAIAGSRLAASGPLTATLTDPTPSDGRDALGTSVHARAVTVIERRPVVAGAGATAVPATRARIEAGAGAVFADREARLVDLDRDGTPEIAVTVSRPDQGSSLAILAKRDGVWRIAAETPPPADRPASWLNPAAFADFLGTGRPQSALVRAPHGDGMLQLWSLEGDRLVLKAEAAGYSNHAPGRDAQDLAAAFSGPDGRFRLAVPSLDRRALAILSFEGGQVRELGRGALPGAAASGVAALGEGAGLRLLVGLEDGRVALVRP